MWHTEKQPFCIIRTSKRPRNSFNTFQSGCRAQRIKIIIVVVLLLLSFYLNQHLSSTVAKNKTAVFPLSSSNLSRNPREEKSFWSSSQNIYFLRDPAKNFPRNEIAHQHRIKLDDKILFPRKFLLITFFKTDIVNYASRQVQSTSLHVNKIGRVTTIVPKAPLFIGIEWEREQKHDDT